MVAKDGLRHRTQGECVWYVPSVQARPSSGPCASLGVNEDTMVTSSCGLCRAFPGASVLHCRGRLLQVAGGDSSVLHDQHHCHQESASPFCNPRTARHYCVGQCSAVPIRGVSAIFEEWPDSPCDICPIPSSHQWAGGAHGEDNKGCLEVNCPGGLGPTSDKFHASATCHSMHKYWEEPSRAAFQLPTQDSPGQTTPRPRERNP